MFAPGMGAPFGYGMPGAFGMAPQFGYSFGMQFPTQPGAGHPPATMDPEAIQRQIEQLHAQLAMLQAANQGFQTHTAPASHQQPTPPPARVAGPPVWNTDQPASASNPVAQPPNSSQNERERDDLEEKAPVPAAAETPAVAEPPVESRVPPAPQTEAERRREELRRRYNRIYSGNSSVSADAEETKGE